MAAQYPNVEFRKISDFNRGILFRLLADSYSFDPRWQEHFAADWLAFDHFFFDNLPIADQCGFITTLNDEPIGHISWDPRNRPEYVQIGHNCITTRCKGNGYGKMQLQEAIRRIRQNDGIRKIVVTTNDRLIAAQRNYESVGFQLRQRRENKGDSTFAGVLIDYEMICD